MPQVLMTCLPLNAHFLCLEGHSSDWAVALPQVTKVVFPLLLGTSPGNPKGGKRGCLSHISLGAGEGSHCGLSVSSESSTCQLKYTGFKAWGFRVRQLWPSAHHLLAV